MANLKNFLQKTFNLAIRASTKATTIFFFAITATVAGGLFTFFTGGPAAYNAVVEVRAPASAGRPIAGLGGAKSANAGLHSYSLPTTGDSSSMPLNYDERANNQGGGGSYSGGEQVSPAAMNLDSSSSILRGAQQRSANELRKNAAVPSTSTSLSTATSSSTATDSTLDSSSSNAGGSTDTSTSTSSSTSTGPRYLYLGADGSALPGLCVPVTITFYDTSVVAAAVGADTAVYVSATGGSLFSNSACSATTTSVTVAAGNSSGTFWFKSSATGTFTVRAEHSSYNTHSVSITVAAGTATLVLGQPSFTSNTANNGGIGAGTLNGTYHLLRVGTKLLVADTGNHRVLIWNSVPTSTQQAADLVLGQPDFTSNTANNGGIGAATLSSPEFLASDGTRLFVSDRGNNRVLIWNTIPTTTQQAASLVLGQPDFTSNTANNGGIGAGTLNSPEGISTDGTHLVICDALNYRVLVWNTLPTSNQEAPSLVIGQTNFTSNTANAGAAVSSAGFDEPYDVLLTSSRLFVADASNNRVLGYSSLPTASGATADFVLGQTSFTANAADSGGVSGAGLDTPVGLAADASGRLLVADQANSRVLVWNSVPSTNAAAADAAFGQSVLTTETANNGGVTASSMNSATGIASYENELWVADWQNHRVLQFTLP